MMNDRVDVVFTRRIQTCAADRHLPSDFSDRLVTSLRRRRRLRRVKVVSLILALTLLGGFFGYFTTERPDCPQEAALVAADQPRKEAQSAGWMLLGFFKECFRRNKVTKRKEEEESCP